MQILDDLYAETRRLFIAGSKFAKDDPRILKYIPVLEKMGEKAPVMKKLAQRYTELTKEGQPEALAEAGMFLYAVMATQGETEVGGSVAAPVSSIRRLPKTTTPYSRMKPLIEALTLSKQGRFEVIKEAFEEGLLQDFRLYGHVATALDDKYSVLAEYIYRSVIPGIGSAMIPYLLEQYDLNGKQSDAMRLSLLGKLGYEEAEHLAFKAIGEGSLPVAAEGVKILGQNPKNEAYLLTLANDKKAEMREAALIGLVNMNSASGKELMIKLLQSSKYKSAIPAATLCVDREYVDQLLAIVQKQYEALLENELKDDEFQKANNKFTELLSVLENKDEPVIYEFYKHLLSDKTYIKRVKAYKGRSYLISDMQSVIGQLLRKSPAERLMMVCKEVMTVQIAQKSPEIIKDYYHSAQKAYTAAHMFDIFAPYYVAGTISFIDMFCPNGFYPDESKDPKDMEEKFQQIRLQIEPRWKKLFIQQNDIHAMRVLLCEGAGFEKEIKDVILKKVKEASDKKRADLGLGLAVGRLVEIASDKKALFLKSELEKVAEVCYEFFEKNDGYHVPFFYEGIGEESFVRLFKPHYVERFRELAKKKTARVFREIEEVLSR